MSARPSESARNQPFWTAPAERQRRRRVRNGVARSTGQTRSVVTTRSKAVSRCACHRSPKLAEGVLDSAGRAPAASALSKTERHVRLVRPAWSLPHVRKRCRAALAAAVQNWPRAFWTAPAERQRRRRFRKGAARSTGQTRSVVTTRSKAVSRCACHRSPKSLDLQRLTSIWANGLFANPPESDSGAGAR